VLEAVSAILKPKGHGAPLTAIVMEDIPDPPVALHDIMRL
jgi:hypothetical protein